MIEIKNESRYISNNTLKTCFNKGKHNYIDKVITGNGFSTAFLVNKPPEGMCNIMIAPNRAVVLDKMSLYHNGKLNEDLTMSFFLKDSVETDFSADILVFVLDSFVNYKSKIEQIQNKINWILIDEFHSIEIQSSFREKLVNFDRKVDKYLSDTVGIVSVTASPNKFSKVTHKIINNRIPNIIINESFNFIASVERVRECLRGDEPTIIFTNNWRVPYLLRDKDDSLKAKYIIGITLERSMREAIKMIEDNSSNLYVISSTGFEGIDIYGFGYNVFFFEDRSSTSDTFYFSNLYQAINRTRDQAKYIEYARSDIRKSRKKKPAPRSVYNLVANQNLSSTEKQGVKYIKLHEFIEFHNDDDIIHSRVNEVAVNLWKETLEYDKFYDTQFLNDRNISINNIDEEYVGWSKPRLSDEYKIENLLNQKVPKDLYSSDYALRVYPYRKIDDKFKEVMDIPKYSKEVNKYLRRKNYDGNYVFSSAEIIGQRLFNNPQEMEELIENVVTDHDKIAKEVYSRRKAVKRIARFKKIATETVYMFVQAFINRSIHIPKKVTGHRDYNITSRIKINTIKIISHKMGVDVVSFDIKSAFPKILYALNGMSLPNGFYGENKENKVGINVAINDFFYDNEKVSTIFQQRKNSKKRLKKLGIDDKVVDWMMDKFFVTKFRGDIFHLLSYHEKKIMDQVGMVMDKVNKQDGFSRRHDEMAVFNYRGNGEEIGEVSYLGFKGWF